MKVEHILSSLEKYYNPYYFVPNIYFFKHPYKETDALIVKKNGYLYDVEIKLTVADYKADFKKKDKHSILNNGYFKTKRGGIFNNKRYKKGSNVPHNDRPNRFYYAVPKSLINVKDLPEYAGLLYICNGKVEKVKEAKLLHKNKIKYDKRLCRKFYFYWKNLKNDRNKRTNKKKNG